MAGKSIFGSSVSISNEFNFKGKRTEVKSKGKACTPVKMSDLTPPVDVEPFVPFLMGAVPVCSGRRKLSSYEQDLMGALSVGGSIQITKNPETAKYMFNYILSLLKVVDGASTQNGKLSEDELKKLLMSLMSKWLEESGPGFVSYKEVLMDIMQNATLQDFMKGMQDSICAMIGDPVNANTGNFIHEKEDLVIKGQIPLCFKRFYNSTDKRTGVMGMGWHHNYEIRLFAEKDRYIILWGDGREEIYLRDDENGPQPLFGLPCRLKLGKETYLYGTQEGVVYIFDKEGRLTTQEDSNGQGCRFTYDKQGRLNNIRSSSGTSLYYKYDGFCGLLGSVTDHTGRCVTLTYEIGRLKEVKNPGGQIYLYTYGLDKRISKIRNSRGIYVLENIYDDRYRTQKQNFADGGKIQYDYQDSLSRTLVTEQNRNKVAYVHDEKFRNIKTIYMDGEETFRYNDRNQLIVKTDKNGNKTKLSYDDRGNTTQIIYADGEKRSMTYDAGNHLIALTINGILKVRNTYDMRGNLIKTTDALERCQEIEYDDKGNAVKIKQPDASEINMQYDDHGNIRCIADAAGNCTSYEYDDCNRVIRTIDGNGNPTNFVYDACNQIIGVTNADGSRRTYEYTENGKVKRVVDFNGAVTSLEYNSMNQVESFIGPDGGATHMEYDLMQNIARKVLPNGAEIKYTYDNLNRIEQMMLPTGGIVLYEYDPKGNRTAVNDPEGNRTIMEYDERDRLTKITNPSGASEEYEYDLDGFLTCVTNFGGKSHTFTYDKVGNVISETDISGNTTSYEYNKFNKLTCITDSKKRKTIYEYAPGGILLKTIYPNDTCETYSYDKNGNQIRRQNDKGGFLEFTYDHLNRLTAAINSFNQEVVYTYNANGEVTSVKDTNGNMTYYDYSAEGKLISVIDAAGNRTEYAYDAMGKLVTICQHQGKDILLRKGRNTNISSPGDNGYIHYTYYKRDPLGNIEAVTNPLGLQEHYSYDLSGRMVLKRDREGFETRYAYNPVGDIERVTYADGRNVSFSYNSLHQLLEVQDWLGTTQIEMDDVGRAKAITDHKGRTIYYEWGIRGEREALIYPNGKKVSYEYDDLCRLVKLKDGMQEIDYNYNMDGRLCDKIFSNGITINYQYNPMGLLSKLIHQKDGVVLEQYEYEYDQMCNKIGIQKKRSATYQEATVPKREMRWIQDDNGYYQYKYDSLNRLTEVRRNRESLHNYAYDAFGNRISKRTEEGSVSYLYNAANQLIGTEGGLSEETYQYDARGNMTVIRHGTKLINQYVYDETNRLAFASNSRGEAAQYEYDGLGNRVGRREYLIEKPDSGSTLADIVQNINPFKEADYLLDLTKKYHNIIGQIETSVDGASIQNYVWDFNAVFVNEGDNSQVCLQDEMGSTIRRIGVQDEQQTIYGYDEFGLDLFGNQGEGQPFGYTGYQKDDITNTYFAQAREYLPEMGRFGSKDLIYGVKTDPLTLNRYWYCKSSPVNWVDLDGLQPKEDGWWVKGLKWITGDCICINRPTKPEPELPNDFRRIPDNSRKLLFDVSKSIDNAVKEVDKIIDIEVETGVGFGVKAQAGAAKGEAVAKLVYLEMDEHGKVKVKSGVDLSTDIAGADIGIAGNYSYLDKTPYGRVSVNPFNYDGDLKVGFEIGAYAVLGGSASISINLSEILRLIEGSPSNKLGCDSQK